MAKRKAVVKKGKGVVVNTPKTAKKKNSKAKISTKKTQTKPKKNVYQNNDGREKGIGIVKGWVSKIKMKKDVPEETIPQQKIPKKEVIKMAKKQPKDVNEVIEKANKTLKNVGAFEQKRQRQFQQAQPQGQAQPPPQNIQILRMPQQQQFQPQRQVDPNPASYETYKKEKRGGMNVRMKLMLGFMLMIVLSGALGVVSYVMLNKVTGASTAENHLDDIHLTLLEMRRAEKDFLLRETTNPTFFSTGESKHIEKFTSQYQRASNALRLTEDKIKKISPENLPAIEEMTLAFDLYNTKFILLTEKKKEKGFKDWGLVGSFRDSVHDIENAAAADVNPILISLLTIRKHEKDYFIRGELTYIDRLEKEVSKFKSLVASSNLAQADKTKFNLLINDYKTKFDRVVAIDKEIGLTSNIGIKGEYRNAVHKIEPLFNEVNEDVEAVVEGANKTAILAIVGLLIVVVLAGIGSGFFLSNSISKPPTYLTDMTKEIGRGNLDLNIYVKTGDELEDLASSFNQMTKDLKGGREQIMKNNEELTVTNEELQTTAEELKSSNEEMQATNEELKETTGELEKAKKQLEEHKVELERKVTERTKELSTKNEELQTTAEELKSSNEEMQATNEELKQTTQQLEKSKKELESAKTGLEGEVQVRTKELEEAKVGLEKEVASRTAELQNKLEQLEKFSGVATERELKMVELKKKVKELEAKLGHVGTKEPEKA